MSQTVSVDFQINGNGWADLRLAIGDKVFVEHGVSYTTDVLGDLVRAALLIAVGAPEARASFDLEPAESRIVLNSLLDVVTGFGPVQIRVFHLQDAHVPRPDDEGILAFTADCRALDFAKAVARTARVVEAQYQQFSDNNTFPKIALVALEAALDGYSGLYRSAESMR